MYLEVPWYGYFVAEGGEELVIGSSVWLGIFVELHEAGRGC